jgi:hypothetical protein
MYIIQVILCCFTYQNTDIVHLGHYTLSDENNV